MSDIARYSDQTFESIKHLNESGQEFWFARELQVILEYTEWRNFINIIDKAKIACRNSNADIEDHFVDINEMVRNRFSSGFATFFYFINRIQKITPICISR